MDPTGTVPVTWTLAPAASCKRIHLVRACGSCFSSFGGCSLGGTSISSFLRTPPVGRVAARGDGEPCISRDLAPARAVRPGRSDMARQSTMWRLSRIPTPTRRSASSTALSPNLDVNRCQPSLRASLAFSVAFLFAFSHGPGACLRCLPGQLQETSLDTRTPCPWCRQLT